MTPFEKETVKQVVEIKNKIDMIEKRLDFHHDTLDRLTNIINKLMDEK